MLLLPILVLFMFVAIADLSSMNLDGRLERLLYVVEGDSSSLDSPDTEQVLDQFMSDVGHEEKNAPVHSESLGDFASHEDVIAALDDIYKKGI